MKIDVDGVNIHRICFVFTPIKDRTHGALFPFPSIRSFVKFVNICNLIFGFYDMI